MITGTMIYNKAIQDVINRIRETNAIDWQQKSILKDVLEQMKK